MYVLIFEYMQLLLIFLCCVLVLKKIFHYPRILIKINSINIQFYFADIYEDSQIQDYKNNVQYVMSSKRGRLILYGDYTFHITRTYKHNRYWVCSKFHHSRCAVKIKTIGHMITMVKGHHNHPPPRLNEDYFYDPEDFHESFFSDSNVDQKFQPPIDT